MSTFSRRLTLILFLTLAVAPLASAQVFGRVEELISTSGQYFKFIPTPGMRTVQVEVLGAVKTPGLYEIGEGTNLGQVMSLAGGPALTARSSNTDVTVMVRLYRPNTYENLPVFEANLTETVTQPRLYPDLQDGDALIVEVIEKEGFGWRDVLTVLNGAASIIFAIDILTR
ncbi:MAG: SLBB domain-containing protein [Bacteroidota bacterium]